MATEMMILKELKPAPSGFAPYSRGLQPDGTRRIPDYSSSHRGWTDWTRLNTPWTTATNIALSTRWPKWISVYALPETGALCDTADPDEGQRIW